MQPVFLELNEVLELHRDMIKEFGGTVGIRDMGLLESALAAPQSGSRDEHFHVDIYEMAAAYLFHIAKNHPFVDGNKRVAAMAAFVFLKFNGISLKASNPAFEKIVLSVVDGTMSKSAVSEFFRKYAC